MDATNYNAQEFRQKVLSDLVIKTSDSMILMCAILIASVGLNMNSIPVIIGAMLISPLMTPILGIGYGLSVFDFQIVKKAALLLFVEVVVSLVVATLYFSISPITYASSELIARTSPTIWDVVIAFTGGVAGIIGARKKTSTNIVPGVAIATALMPPLCTVGYSIATLQFSYFIGASYLFIINSAFIMIATFIGVRFMRFPLHTMKSSKENRRMNVILIILSLLVVVPSIFSAATLVQESIRTSAISQFVKEEFPDDVVLDQDYNDETQKLVVTISGDYMSKSDVASVQDSLADYGLEDVTLDIDQIPDLNELDGAELKQYLDKYISNQEDNKSVEQQDRTAN
ncbi:DUF389 domain-containing protein [Listeria rustica]|uniref:DUF389 domain-containing protein n=1 Tax=Listeria rustica TaxID=2713503 RepID=A0A7W1YH05_9LIST|nr:DUF389 domain-containing protein [Listeria rustica]MBA3927154.1 DUF389 domain-containing protein [Listeria rustica]